MSDTITNKEPGALARWAGKTLKSLAVLACVALVAWLAEKFDQTWLVVAPFLLLLLWQGVRQLLLSMEFVAVTFLVLVAATAAGTFMQSIWLYGSLWFQSLEGLLALSTTICVVTRLTRKRGFWLGMVHAAVLLTLAGGLVKGNFKTEGNINMVSGQVANSMALLANGRPTGKMVELPFLVRLDDFKVEFYDGKTEVLVYDLDVSQEEPVLSLLVGSEQEKTARGKTLSVVERTTSEVVPAPGHPPVEADVILVNVGSDTVPIPVNGLGVEHDGLGFLVLELEGGAPKLYQSKLTLLDKNGKTIVSQDVVVNDPLRYNGYWLYQSNWGRTKGGGLYSGIQVVKDPGLPYVFIGLGLLMLSLLVNLLVPARRKMA